jgi:hypothetical protein
MNNYSYFYRRAVLLAALALALVSLPACQTVQVTDNTIGEYRLGELITTVNARFGDAYDATKRAFDDHGLFLTGDDRKVVEAVLTARDRADTLVTVKIKEVAVGKTSVKIRYGLSGDAARSQNLFRDLEKRL